MSRTTATHVTTLLLTLVFAGACPAGDDIPPLEDNPGRTRLGIAVTPAHFPKHSSADVDQAFAEAAQLGSYAVFIYQWGRMDPTVPRLMVEKSREAGLIPVLGLSPTTLTGGRKSLDIPDSVRKAAGANISFANPVIRKAFVDTARELAALRPPLLCLGTEINLLATGSLTEYLQFASLYREAYEAVKAVSPGTRVFVSFQWELIRALDEKAPRRLHEHGKLVDVFRPALDVIALTSYPAPLYDSPADLPEDYYRWLFNHADRSAPVILMEIGWPAAGVGSPQEQAAFIDRLPGLLGDMRVGVIAWALLHDVNLAEFDDNLNSVGLRKRSGEARPGLAAFRALH